jgi:Ca2+-binding RTX toxin-like protein
VIEASSGGIDTVIESVDNYVLPAQVEKLQIAGGIASLRATGNALANTITGNAGNNWLDGGAGNDTMAGGLGDDTYVLDSTGDVVTEAAGEGNDTVRSAVTYTLPANLENLILTGTSKINGTGNTLDNVLIGNSAANTLSGGAGNDRLDGGAGADAMTGGLGNDTYVVDSTSDSTVEMAGGGVDTVETALTWTLATEVERLTLTGTSAVNGTGNASINWLAGNSAANILNGAAGADVLLGGDGNDVLQDTAGNGALDGGLGSDALTTGVGNDLLAAGAGNDTYTLGGGADIVAFNLGDGADAVNAPVSGAGLGESNDTISLGGIRLGDLTFSRVGSDLVLKINGTSDSLLLKGWYLAAGDQTVTKLQVVVDSSSDYAPGSADALRASRIATLSFTQLVAAYDAARAVNPALVNWAPSETLLQNARVGSSDALALGGNLVYRYAHDGALANVAYDAITQQLASSGFGTIAQAIADFSPLGTAPPSPSAQALGLAPAQDTVLSTDPMTGGTAPTGTGTSVSTVTVVDASLDLTVGVVETGAVFQPNCLAGFGGNDTLTGGAMADTLQGNGGDDVINGGMGADTYLFERGDGRDTLLDVDATAGVQDLLQFGGSIAADQIWLRKVDGELEVSILGTTDKVTVSGWFLGSDHHVEMFRTADGKQLLDGQVQNLVQAMAAFAPPAIGQTTLPSAYQSLESVIATSWQ